MKDLTPSLLKSMCILFLFLFMRDAMANNFIEEVMSATKNNRNTRISVTDIARKHFLIGSEKSVVVQQLHSIGFKCYPQNMNKDKNNDIDLISCSFDMSTWYDFTSSKKLWVRIVSKNGTVTDIVSEIRYIST